MASFLYRVCYTYAQYMDLLHMHGATCCLLLDVPYYHTIQVHSLGDLLNLLFFESKLQ